MAAFVRLERTSAGCGPSLVELCALMVRRCCPELRRDSSAVVIDSGFLGLVPTELDRSVDGRVVLWNSSLRRKLGLPEMALPDDDEGRE